jgi:transcriptional regulator with XRE-family HTH domain
MRGRRGQRALALHDLIRKPEMGQRGRDPRDAEIAKRLRALRLQRGLSQNKIGSMLGVTFQQVQKYEGGRNRITAARLYRIAEALDVPITFFFPGPQSRRTQPDAHASAVQVDLLQTLGAMRLLRAYSRISHRGVRMRLVRLAECLAGEC